MKTFDEWMTENEKLCRRASGGDGVSIQEMFDARDDAGLIVLPTALKIIRHLYSHTHGDSRISTTKSIEAIINEEQHG